MLPSASSCFGQSTTGEQARPVILFVPEKRFKDDAMPDTAAEKLLTVAEFLGRYPPPGSNRRWQLIDGRPVAMAPTTRRHRHLARRLVSALNRRLSPPCEAEQEACIRPLHRRKADSYYLADVATSCVPLGDGTYTPAPVIVAALLSADDRKDRGAKLDDYRELPPVMAVLLFDQKLPRVEIHERQSDGSWPDQPVIAEGMDVLLVLSAHNGLQIPLPEIYQLG